MAEIVSYIKQCYKPSSELEFIELFPFDFKLGTILTMVNDAIFVIYNCNDNTFDINVLENYKSELEYIIIGDIIIGRRTIKQIEWFNQNDNSINFPEKGNYLYQRLSPYQYNPVKYETVNHTFIISELIKATHVNKKNMYIEFGTRTNENFDIISELVDTSIGVDTNPLKFNKNIYTDTTDHFSEFILPQIIKKTFTRDANDPNRLKFNYAFIDADHSFESVFKDFENLFKYLESGGFIILHDVYPYEQRFLEKNACHDCYLAPIAIKAKYSKYINILTLPLCPGMSIIQKKA
jgi:hypothetical protein